MPRKTANSTKKVSSAIISLEKTVAKVKQQLMKARVNEANKLEKNASKLNSALKQTKAKMAALSKKKGAGTERQKLALTSKIIDFKLELRITKEQLSQAKKAIRQALEIEKAITIEKKLANKKKKQASKTTLEKKAVKKIVKKVAKPLTPDLSQPVAEKNKKPTKNWKPAIKEIKTLPDAIVDIKNETQSDSNKGFTLQETSTKQNTKEETKTAELKIENKPSHEHKAAVEPAQEVQAETKTEAAKDNEESLEKSIMNWHTMPILRKHDD